MPLNTLTVAVSTTPTFISTLFSHLFSAQPSAFGLSYSEGVALIRRFLNHASNHTVEDLQAFTAMYVPAPVWVRTESVVIGEEFLDRSAEVLAAAGVRGKWWRWREGEMQGEWVWVNRRERWWGAEKGVMEERQRTVLYVHGGAYYFGSVDEHRYQLQRHARKLEARVFAPRYRLAPQFPFPCALYDVLAAYLHLLSLQPATTILFAGDSAGGGLLLSLLCLLRDHSVPLPAGACLLSPWVDLTHSFPSVTADNSRDYIPTHGFHHRPSPAWPPPPCTPIHVSIAGSASVAITEQMQFYATNAQLSHPLVSPVNQPSLAGLPPLMILTGGGEVLRDEQLYVAHKAAFPALFGCDNGVEGTRVWLQVFENACHVLPTLAWTRPAKRMGESVRAFAEMVWDGEEWEGPLLRYEEVSTVEEKVTTVSPLTPQDFPSREVIGVVAAEPVKRWLEARKRWDRKFPVRERLMIVDAEDGEEDEDEEERAPPSAAYRRRRRESVEGEKISEGEMKREKGWGMSMWAGWSAKSDKRSVVRDEKQVVEEMERERKI